MIDIGLLEEGLDWASDINRKGDKKLYLKIDRIHDKYSKYIGDHRIIDSEPMGLKEFKQKLSIQSYYDSYTNVRKFGGK